MKSLDPRINRWGVPENWPEELEKGTLDQLETFEVFVQPKEGRPYQHEGIVHASDVEMAFVFAKEQFSRRGTCTGIMIARSADVSVSEFTEDTVSVYDQVDRKDGGKDGQKGFEVFHLMKRGKQHKHAGSVKATSPEEALSVAKEVLNPEKPVYNVWIIASDSLMGSEEGDQDIWATTPEKVFREAIAYKGADKIKQFKEEQEQS